jgi:hypothetical protein
MMGETYEGYLKGSKIHICFDLGSLNPIVPFLTEINMFKEVFRIAIGERPHRLTSVFMNGYVYRFLKPKPGIVKKI